MKLATRLSLAAVTGLGAVTSALAVPPATVGDLATGIDFSAVGLAILAVFAAGITLAVTVKGGQWVYHKVKSI